MLSTNKHLWYLAEETVTMSLCSDKLSLEEKASIANEIAAKADFVNDLSMRGPPAVFPELTPNTDFTSLTNLVGINSSTIFIIYGISHAWLKTDVTEWEKSTEYQNGKQVFALVTNVTNDCAERLLQ